MSGMWRLLALGVLVVLASVAVVAGLTVDAEARGTNAATEVGICAWERIDPTAFELCRCNERYPGLSGFSLDRCCDYGYLLEDPVTAFELCRCDDRYPNLSGFALDRCRDYGYLLE